MRRKDDETDERGVGRPEVPWERITLHITRWFVYRLLSSVITLFYSARSLLAHNSVISSFFGSARHRVPAPWMDPKSPFIYVRICGVAAEKRNEKNGGPRREIELLAVLLLAPRRRNGTLRNVIARQKKAFRFVRMRLLRKKCLGFPYTETAVIVPVRSPRSHKFEAVLLRKGSLKLSL